MSPQHPATRRRILGFVAVNALAVVLAACGGNGTSSETAGSTGEPSEATGSAGPGKTVTVTETEYELSLSRSAFTPGTYTFKVVDDGQTTHALEIEGPGVGEQESDTLSAGQSTTMTVTLQKGSYELYCPVDGHKDLGMKTEITVG